MRLPSVRSELFLGMIAATLGAGVLSLVSVDLMLRHAARQRIELDLEQAQSAYEQYWALRQSSFASRVEALAGTPFLKATLTIPDVDHGTVLQASETLGEVANCDLLLVLDASQVLLADSTDPQRHGQDHSALPTVREALQGEVQVQSCDYLGVPYEVAAAPITVGEQVAGILLIGSRLDSRAARSIRDVSRADVMILHAGRMVADAWSDSGATACSEGELQELRARVQDVTDAKGPTCFSIVLGRRERLATVLRTSTADDYLILSEDLEKAMQPFRKTELVLGGVGLVAALVSIFVSRFLSDRLAKPIHELTEASRRVAGGDFSACVPASDNQEINTLASAFNGMATQIGGLVRDVEKTTRAIAEAEATARFKAQFLANMSHEIRTPMNGVLGMADLLIESDLSAEQLELARTIQRSGHSLLALINDILDFSKIEAGKLELETIQFDLRSEIEDSADLLATQARAKGIELLVLIPPEIPIYVKGDPTRLRQVLLNLMGNAVKFTEGGRVSLRVMLNGQTEGGVALRFEVSDTGIGIPREAAGHLFQAFTQADPSTTRRFGGSGLGLAISRQLVELMSGEIGVESEAGVGSVFWFTVKLGAVAPEGAASGAEDFGLGHFAVLAVDDDPTSRTMLSYQLRSQVQRFESLESSSRAVQVLKDALASATPYDLVLLDGEMPGTDGFELARMIRCTPELEGLPLVVLSTSSQAFGEQFLAERGIRTVLYKPMRRNQLLGCIGRVLGAERTQSKSAGGLPNPPPALPARSAMRVLLAEDNAINQRVATRMLEKLGCTVEVACNGKVAAQAVLSAKYDLVLMDCQMPEMDGYEASRLIRAQADPNAARVLIVALTANALDGDREVCLAAGMDDFLTKPVTLEALRSALARYAQQLDIAPLSSSLRGSELPIPESM